MTAKREMTNVLPASLLFGWHLLASRCRWALSRFCASWLLSSARRLCSRPFRASRQKSSLALVFCLTGKSCSSLFTPLLKLELAIGLVRFCSFLVHSIHSDRFCSKEVQVLTKLYSRKSVDAFFGDCFFESLLWLVFPRHPINKCEENK